MNKYCTVSLFSIVVFLTSTCQQEQNVFVENNALIELSNDLNIVVGWTEEQLEVASFPEMTTLWATSLQESQDSLYFSSSDSYLVGTNDNNLTVWNAQSGTRVHNELSCDTDARITDIIWIEERDLLLCATGSAADGLIYIIDVNSGEHEQTLRGHQFVVDHLEVGERVLVSASTVSPEVAVWNINDWATTFSLTLPSADGISGIALSSNEETIGIAYGNRIILLNLVNEMVQLEFEFLPGLTSHEDPIREMRWSYDDERLLGWNDANELYVWETQTGTEILKTANEEIVDVFFESESEAVVVYSEGLDVKSIVLSP